MCIRDRFLYDIGVVPTKEPYQKRTSHGMILGLNPHAFENQPEMCIRDSPTPGT